MYLIQKRGVWTIFKASFAEGILLGILFAVLGILSAFFLQHRFQASADFMVSSAQENQDYYTATRSAEYMSRVLGEIVYSENFITALVETGRMDANFLPRDKKDRLEAWSKMLSVRKNAELGFIHVSISGDNERTVSKISQAVIDVLDSKSDTLFGDNGSRVKVRLLSGPILEQNPEGKELVGILIAGIFFGVLSMFSLALLKEEFRSDGVTQ